MAEVGAMNEVAMAADKIDLALEPSKDSEKYTTEVSQQMSPNSTEDYYGAKVKPRSASPYSPWFTIVCAGFALVSDGYQNNLLTVSPRVVRYWT